MPTPKKQQVKKSSGKKTQRSNQEPLITNEEQAAGPVPPESPEGTTGKVKAAGPGPETSPGSSAPVNDEKGPVTPLNVEVHFPAIFDLKQAIKIDAKGFLILNIAFSVKLDNTFELFRLSNLLKQNGSSIYATIGSKQVAMDFMFDPKESTFSIILPETSPGSSAPETDQAGPDQAFAPEPDQNAPEGDKQEPLAIDCVTDETPESTVNPSVIDRNSGNMVCEVQPESPWPDCQINCPYENCIGIAFSEEKQEGIEHE